MTVIWRITIFISIILATASIIGVTSFFVPKYLATSGLVVIGMFLALLIWRLPKAQVPDQIDDAKDRADIENAARDTIIKTLAGIFLLTGAYFTWSQLEIAQDREITSRFNDAIKNLGASREKELARIIGGIYSLEWIAADSERDHWPIMEVLATYVRQNAVFVLTSPEEACKWKGPRSGEAPLDLQAVL